MEEYGKKEPKQRESFRGYFNKQIWIKWIFKKTSRIKLVYFSQSNTLAVCCFRISPRCLKHRVHSQTKVLKLAYLRIKEMLPNPKSWTVDLRIASPVILNLRSCIWLHGSTRCEFKIIDFEKLYSCRMLLVIFLKCIVWIRDQIWAWLSQVTVLTSFLLALVFMKPQYFLMW